jgi:hypothetical protein
VQYIEAIVPWFMNESATTEYTIASYLNDNRSTKKIDIGKKKLYISWKSFCEPINILNPPFYLKLQEHKTNISSIVSNLSSKNYSNSSIVALRQKMALPSALEEAVVAYTSYITDSQTISADLSSVYMAHSAMSDYYVNVVIPETVLKLYTTFIPALTDVVETCVGAVTAIKNVENIIKIYPNGLTNSSAIAEYYTQLKTKYADISNAYGTHITVLTSIHNSIQSKPNETMFPLFIDVLPYYTDSLTPIMKTIQTETYKLGALYININTILQSIAIVTRLRGSCFSVKKEFDYLFKYATYITSLIQQVGSTNTQSDIKILLLPHINRIGLIKIFASSTIKSVLANIDSDINVMTSTEMNSFRATLQYNETIMLSIRDNLFSTFADIYTKLSSLKTTPNLLASIEPVPTKGELQPVDISTSRAYVEGGVSEISPALDVVKAADEFYTAYMSLSKWIEQYMDIFNVILTNATSAEYTTVNNILNMPRVVGLHKFFTGCELVLS